MGTSSSEVSVKEWNARRSSGEGGRKIVLMHKKWFPSWTQAQRND